MTKKDNTAVILRPAPAPRTPRVVAEHGPERRILDIPALAQRLGLTNWRAEELLREGKIRFKWVGKKKMVDIKDADAWWDSLPYAEVTINPRKPVGMDRDLDRFRPVDKAPSSRTRRAKYGEFRKVGKEFVVAIS